MKVMFLDWAGWVYKKPHYLKDFLLSKGVLCYDRQVAPFQFGTLQEPKTVVSRDSELPVCYRGFNLEAMIPRAVYKDARWYIWDRTRVVYRLKEAAVFIDWAFKTYGELRPDYIVVEGGLTHFSRPFVEVARDMGIGVIALENTFIKDKIIIDFDTGCICNRYLFARTAKDWLGTRTLTSEQEEIAYSLLNDLFEKNLRYPTEGKWDYDKPYFFVPLQVYNDQVTVFDSDYNNEQFINLIIQLAYKTPSRTFVLKCHPKEERVSLNRETGNWIDKYVSNKRGVPDNLVMIRDGAYNTQDLISKSEAVIVNNTQAGLEAALLGKRVYVAGDAFYHGHGFTEDISRFDDEPIEPAAKDGDHSDRISFYNALRFFYFFYRELYNHDLTEANKHRISRRLNI